MEKEDTAVDKQLKDILEAYKNDEVSSDDAIRKINEHLTGESKEEEDAQDKIRIDLTITDVGDFLTFINYFNENIMAADPLEPAVELYRNLVEGYENSSEKKDQRVASAMKATYSNGRLDLHPSKGGDAIRLYQKSVEDEDAKRSSYYQDLKKGQTSFAVECRSLLSEDTLAAMKKFAEERREIIEKSESLPDYKKNVTFWLKNRGDEFQDQQEEQIPENLI